MDLVVAALIAVLLLAGGFGAGIVVVRRGRGGHGMERTPGARGLDPIRHDLSALQQRLDDVAREQARSDGAVALALDQLTGATSTLTDETRTLRSSLRDVRVRGSWGELQLRRVVELAGLTEHTDFATQTAVSVDGATVRPDLIVRLPGHRAIVVDAKVPLDAYLDAAQCSDREAAGHRQRHASALASHARALGARQYAEAVDGSIDLVVMFVPGESFLADACATDPHLIERALSHGVVLASPTTLIVLLRTAALGWREQTMADSAREIAELGAELHERVCRFADHFDGLGRSLGATIDGYNRAVGSFESRLAPAARRLAETGAIKSRSLDTLAPVDTRPRRAG